MDDPITRPDWSHLGAAAPLSWMLGSARYGIHPHDPWFHQVSASAGFPVISGLSGTASRLHSIFHWIRPEGVREEHFIRALLGWMLPMEDHSLYEIVRGVELASPHLSPPGGYAGPADLYRRIPGVPPEVIAEIAARAVRRESR
jgi:hypothetical protein